MSSTNDPGRPLPSPDQIAAVEAPAVLVPNSGSPTTASGLASWTARVAEFLDDT